MSGPPKSWNWKSDEEIEGDLRAMYEEEGIPYDEEDYSEPSQESLDMAREANMEVYRKYFGDHDE